MPGSRTSWPRTPALEKKRGHTSVTSASVWRKYNKQRELIQWKEKKEEWKSITWKTEKRYRKSMRPEASSQNRSIEVINLWSDWSVKRRDETQMTSVGNEEVTWHTTDIKRVFRECYEQLDANKSDTLCEMNNCFLKWPKFTQVETCMLITVYPLSKLNWWLKPSHRQNSGSRWLHRCIQPNVKGRDNTPYTDSSRKSKERKHVATHSMKPSPCLQHQTKTL